MVPIIYALLEYGVPSKNIKYIWPWIHRTHDFKNDKRLQYLDKRGIKILVNNGSFVFDRYYNKIVNKSERNILEKLIKKFLEFFLFNSKKVLNINLNYVLLFKDSLVNSVLVFDHNTNELYKLVVAYAKQFQSKCVSVPHGLILFNELPGGESIEKESSKSTELSDIYDFVVMPNRFSLEKHCKLGIDVEKTVILGSARYCNGWMKILGDDIYNVKEIYANNNNLKNVLVFLGKSIVQNSKGELVKIFDFNEVLKVINYLVESKCNLLIMTNTRGISREQSFALTKYSRYISDSLISTEELVAWSDIVVTGATSASIIPIIRNKSLIYLDYCDPVTHVFNEFKINYISFSLDDFKEIFSLLNSKSYISNKKSENNTHFLKRFVYADCESDNVLVNYFKFLNSIDY